MEKREQLLEQHAEWTTRYLEADKHLKELLPPVADLSEDDNFTVWVPTKESLAEFAKVERDLNRALAKMHEIMKKLHKLR